MAVNVNKTALRKAKSFISQGKIDANSSWSFSTSDENELLGENDDWKNYASFHLAEDTEAEKGTKARYKYPWGKDDKIYRRGVIAAKSRAAAQGENDISAAADELLQAIDKKLGKEDVGKAKNDLVRNNMRIDFYDSEYIEEVLEKPFVANESGFLTGRAIFTNIGVFPYMLEDGSVRWELRPPEEVFDMESIESFQMIPLTNDHPGQAVDIENVKDVQVGYTGEDIRNSEYHLSIPIVITDQETIDACKERGKRALSAGYTVDLEMVSGVWMGVPYDAIQRNIRGNHIAVVDRGRAGDDAVMKFDSIGYTINNSDRRESMNLKNIRIDGVGYEADQKIIDLYTDAEKNLEKEKKENEGLRADISTMEAERDQAREELEALKKDNNEKMSEAAIEAAVKSRIVVLDAAKRAKVEITSKMDETEIKKQIVIALFPATKEKMDKCEPAYLDARFDGALEKLDELVKSEEKLDAEMLDDTIASDDSGQKKDSDIAYEKAVEAMQNRWKTKEVQ